MSDLDRFSEPIELPGIPEGPGIALIINQQEEVLQITSSKNIRRRIGELMDSEGQIAVHGPKIYEAQQNGERILIRWKHTPDYKTEKKGSWIFLIHYGHLRNENYRSNMAPTKLEHQREPQKRKKRYTHESAS